MRTETERPRPTDQRGPAPAVDLGPFVAWLASRVDDEDTRRRCRSLAESYLDWSFRDGGPPQTRRARFVAAATAEHRLRRKQVEDALDRLAEHRAVVAQTLPLDT